MNKGARQTETEDIYENADAMKGKITMKTEDSYTKRIQPPEHTGRDCVKIINYRSAVVCLVLLCVLLLTAVIALGVTFTQERQQLIFKNKNLTNQRDQLRNNSQIHDGWICYQSTCYYISKEMKNWNESRQDCLNRGADLIIINNRQEQDFVTDMPGVAAVYIGLADTNLNGTWKWVDGTLTSGFSFWALKEPTGGIENCAVTVAVSQLKFGSDCVKFINYRAAAMCLVLLCVLLLTAVIVLCVTFTQEKQQLISKNENLTNEREQLIVKNTDLTSEINQLILKNTDLTNENKDLTIERERLLRENIDLKDNIAELDNALQTCRKIRLASDYQRGWATTRVAL
ncbi:CD209 antigen-like protein [Labeo rohita]|uniref:CD209 antigen-like protein n=1 Tax=Labeo rohita TaxID=84645 RepID=A0A498NL63_LABRO|nr:CD209 antigen-like protein [Labeo rohita]RXN32700.1 CD209 antigen-like protein [Labeo rohita]